MDTTYSCSTEEPCAACGTCPQSDGEDITLAIGQHVPAYADFLANSGFRTSSVATMIRSLTAVIRECDPPTPAGLIAYCERRGLARGTHYQYFAVVAGFMRWAFDRALIDHDPFSTARRPAKQRYVARPASDRDVELILRYAREPVWSWAIFALYAGLRCCEVADVCGRHLMERSGGGWDLFIPNGKGGKEARVPAHPAIVALLYNAPRGQLFPDTTARHVSERARAEFARIGVRARMHSLRHTFATELYRATHDVLTVQQALRHENLNTTANYIAFDTERLHDAVIGLTIGGAARVAGHVAGDKHDDRHERDRDLDGHVDAGQLRQP